MVATLEAKKRHDLKKSTIKEFRLHGQVPAILYGKKTDSQPIAVDSTTLVKTLRDNGRNAIISLEVDQGEQHQVIVNDYQVEPLKGDILHVDFFEVDMKSEMDAEVAVKLEGVAPGAREGGIVSHLLHTMKVRCLPTDIPEEMTVDISQLQVGDSIQVRDMSVNPSIQLTNDPEETIVTVTMAAAKEEPGQDPEAVEDEAEEAKEEKQEE